MVDKYLQLSFVQFTLADNAIPHDLYAIVFCTPNMHISNLGCIMLFTFSSSSTIEIHNEDGYRIGDLIERK